MTHYDAGATPMFAAFAKDPVLTPWEAEKPRTPLDELNPPLAHDPTVGMDFRDADRVDENRLNAVLWRAIRGVDAPAPVSSFFSRR
jgi:hypothetical protein